MKYNFRPKINSASKISKKKIWPFFVVLLIIAYIIIALLLPISKITATKSDIPIQSAYTARISWPARGQIAVGAADFGVLATSGEQKSAPIASIAKTVLALSIVNEKPISSGEQGPSINITQADVDLYSSYLKQNGSVVPVQVNEKLTQYQMLQALLIPSGDNIADTLATWGFGSVSEYLNYANKYVADLGLKQTHLADAGGLSSQTVSSAYDLVLLGEKVLDNPVLAEIVNQKDVTLPVAGKVKNYNTILGQENIIGIKTGNTDEAGGCLLFATKENIEGKDVNVIGAILGANSRNDALQETLSFLQTNVRNFQMVTVVKAGQKVGTYDVPWGGKIDVVAKNDLNILVVNGQKISTSVDMNNISGVKEKGGEVGSITAKAGTGSISVPITLSGKISKPSVFWRILHP